MENKVLGKGLSALIPERPEQASSDNVMLIKTNLIKDNRLQPRTYYDEEKLSELVASIKEKGVLQPILVRKSGSDYEVIAGERRLKAARILSLESVPVVVKTVTDREALVLALVENIQREDLNPIEEALSFKKLVEDFNFSQEEVAKSVGKDRSTVSNLMRLLRLPDNIQRGIFTGDISTGHARALLSVEDKALQEKIFNEAVSGGLSVREIEGLVKKALQVTPSIEPKKEKTKLQDVTSLEEELQRALGTKVRVSGNNKKGKILIEYYSLEDLDRIIGILKK